MTQTGTPIVTAVPKASFLASPTWRWVRRGVTLLLLLAVLDYVVLPQVAGTRAALDLIGSVQPWWAALAIALEGSSLLCYSMLTRSVLPDARPTLWWLLRADLTALGVGHVLPGGGAAATALRYRLLRQGGAPAEDAGVGIAVEGVGSVLVLVALWWLSLVASIPFLGFHTTYVVIAAATASLGVVVAIALYERSRHPDRPRLVLDHVIGWLPARIGPRIRRIVATARQQFDDLVANPHDLRRSALWATGNWVCDAASLWVFLLAFGHYVNPVEVFVGYGLATLLASLPISPGGLGIVEAVLISSLVGFGTARATAVLAVISWRLFEFWAPIPIAGLAYASLRVQAWRHPPVARGVPDPPVVVPASAV